MTQYPEAWLCRELGMAVVNISLITDYDAGVLEGTEAVDAKSVLEVFQQNAERIQAVVLDLIGRFPADLDALGAGDALRFTRGDGHAISPEDIRLFETGLWRRDGPAPAPPTRAGPDRLPPRRPPADRRLPRRHPGEAAGGSRAPGDSRRRATRASGPGTTSWAAATPTSRSSSAGRSWRWPPRGRSG